LRLGDHGHGCLRGRQGRGGERLTGRFIHGRTGIVVSVADHKDGRFTAPWRACDGSGGSDYWRMKLADLRAEIQRRNGGRDAADLLPVEGRKADLVAALEADDAAQTEQ